MIGSYRWHEPQGFEWYPLLHRVSSFNARSWDYKRCVPIMACSRCQKVGWGWLQPGCRLISLSVDLECDIYYRVTDYSIEATLSVRIYPCGWGYLSISNFGFKLNASQELIYNKGLMVTISLHVQHYCCLQSCYHAISLLPETHCQKNINWTVQTLAYSLLRVWYTISVLKHRDITFIPYNVTLCLWSLMWCRMKPFKYRFRW